MTNFSEHQRQLLDVHDMFPIGRHPLWISITKHELSFDQVIKAEVQHYVRSKRGQSMRKRSVDECNPKSGLIYQGALDNYLEEVVPNGSGPSHLDLIEKLLIGGGAEPDELARAQPTPGNVAAIALYEDITNRGTACHLIGAGLVEYYYSQLAPKIYEVYTSYYGMTEDHAETYRIHGPQDALHSTRALDAVEEAVVKVGWETIYLSVRDAFVATSLHYDGMLQAATGEIKYWDGRS